ncbi:MAG: transposase [Planctomycetaceae bacterium]|jgi:REP element-mobilizing transposase RayT|nr:transposase [Planctomycetaceae bacterium]
MSPINPPLAYLITFTCYGQWLHGDERSSVDRKHNKYETEFVKPNQELYAEQTKKMRQTPVILGDEERKIVEKTIKEVCSYRKWELLEINVRTNHVHVVATGNTIPDKIMGDFKAYATRRLKESGFFVKNVWTEGGSTRYLWDDESVVAACHYARNQ